MKSINGFADRVLNRMLATGRAQASITVKYEDCRNFDCDFPGCKRYCCRTCTPVGDCGPYSCGACVC